MSELQAMVVNWLSVLVVALPVSYAFGAGMVAAVNPCGFAMLPAYLSLYLGLDDEQAKASSPSRRLGNALAVGLTVSAGFVLLFAIAGFGISAGGNVLLRYAPWFGAVVGVILVGLGIWMLAGRTVSTPFFEQLADRIGTPGTRSRRSFFLFGLAYGLASLSCTLPIFMIAVGSALTGGSLVAGFVRFSSYAMGMATVMVVLTVMLGFFKMGFVGRLRKALPYVQRASAILLIFAGGYIVFYWWPFLT